MALPVLQGTFVIPIALASGGYSFAYWNFGSNNCESACQYFFKKETRADLAYTTLSGVAVRYKNIAQVTLTVSIVGTYTSRTVTLILGQTDPTGTGNPVLNRQYYGAPPPLGAGDGKDYTAYFYFNDFTDDEFQVQLSLAANAGPLVLTQVSVFEGDAGEYPR